MAGVLKELESTHALVVHGEGGLDEISTLGSTRVSELRNHQVQTYEIRAVDFGLGRATMESLRGTDAATNAEIMRAVFSGRKGAPRDIVLLNAGAAVFVAGIAGSLKEGIEKARESVDTGAAIKKLESWVEATNS